MRVLYLYFITFVLGNAFATEKPPEISIIPVSTQQKITTQRFHVPSIIHANSDHKTEGFASWYGGKFQGRKTANGEIFDTNLPTAAHKTLPFGTMVLVTNLHNGKHTKVRINDRGPFVENRIIDLSRKAATDLGMLQRGVARVRLNILSFPNTSEFYNIQISSFSNMDNAESLVKELSKNGVPVKILSVQNNNIHRVVWPHVQKSGLKQARKLLSRIGYSSVLIQSEALP